MKIIFFALFILSHLFLSAQGTSDDLIWNKDTNSILKLIDSAKALRFSDYVAAEKFAEMAKVQSGRIGYSRGEALSYSIKASVYYNKGDLPEAEKLAHIALDKLQVCGTLSEISDAVNRLGLICMSQAKYYLAQDFFQRSMEMSSRLKDTVGIIIAAHNLGVISYYKSDFGKTARYYNLSLRLAEKIRDEKRINVNLLNLGLLYDTERDFGNAKHYILKPFNAKDIVEKINGVFAAIS